jgi:hypothetical protein
MAANLVACAKGGAFVGTGGSSDGGSGGEQTTSTGNGGTTGSTTSTGATGGSGGSTTTTGGTTTTMCDEAPCKLVAPQCGCPDGEMCSIKNTGDIACHAPGTKQLDEECVGLYGCDAGLLCLNASSTKSVCGKYCDDDSQCSGGLCLIELTDPSNPPQSLPGVTLCTDDCSPLTNAGCQANLGLSCQIGQEQTGQMRTFTICSGSGSGAQGSTCVDSEDCAVGSACFTLSDNSLVCLKYCNVGNPVCPGAAACSPFSEPLIYKGIEYGACL